MDSEQLKLILDALASMGEGGKEAFIYWLVMTEVVPAITIIFSVAAVVYGVNTTFRISRELAEKKEKRTDVEAYAAMEVERLYREHVRKHAIYYDRSDVAKFVRHVEPLLRKAKEETT